MYEIEFSTLNENWTTSCGRAHHTLTSESAADAAAARSLRHLSASHALSAASLADAAPVYFLRPSKLNHLSTESSLYAENSSANQLS